MHRCLVHPDAWTSGSVSLDPPESHHLHQVIRARPGQIVGVFDGQGRSAEACVGALQDQLDLVPGSLKQQGRGVYCTLYLAVLKPARMDVAIEKATELGVARIVPLSAEHCVAQVSVGDVDKKVARWVRIATSAAKQCGTPWLPEICAPIALASLCDRIRAGEWLVVGALAGDPARLKDALRDQAAVHQPRVGLAIGPEGDFSPDEMEQLLSAGAVPVSFGDRVLRAETAALFGLSVIMSELDDAHR